ncbi:DUF3558 domain-containing protein [Tomitella gaofuii]|uniref:DUF3558 domain-containing protein n=1 Tax=Tomitella gaofuii TaxID=2760083 RepID=UPI001F36E872|nr:DUF3558 domain-containing protein [Tomitella gaofuii]
MAACGGQGGPADGARAAEPSESASPAPSAGVPAEPGPALGMCGSVTDAELAATTEITLPLTAVRDTVGCQWDVGLVDLGSHVSFTWYRGSPIGRERAIDGAVGRVVQDVTVAGQPGFSSQADSSLCEVGVQYGADFFLWSVSYGVDEPSPPTGGVCDVAMTLATMTAERAG